MRRLQHRLFAPVLVVLAAMVGAVGYAAYEAFARSAALRAQVDGVQRASELVVRLNALGGETQANVLRYLARRDASTVADLERLNAETKEAIRELGNLQPSPTGARLYEQFVVARNRTVEARAQLLAAARARDARAIELAQRRWDLARRRGDALLADVSGYSLNQLQRTMRDLDRRRSTSLALLGLALALSFGVVLVYAWIVSRTLVRPIAALTRAASGLPAGRFEPSQEAVGRTDEIGVLARTLLRVMQEMQAANERLRDADRRKDEFLSVLSHELRNPLAPIRNSVYVLHRADPASEPWRRARDVIHRQIDHLARLVDDLLDVTRIARGKVEVRREPLDLAGVVRRAADDHRSLLASRGLRLEVDAPATSIWVNGDATRLAQIVGNLLLNAGKFTLPGGEVSLSVEARGAMAEIRVRDTGVGIEPELLAHVFEPFVQSDRSLARTQGGLGLGLALVKGLVELHGGTVNAASGGPGMGAELVVSLPIANVAHDVRLAAPGPGLAGPGVRRVLIVDDDADAADSLAELVRLLGHAADVAYDGPSAVAKASTTHYDLVLCDIGLPGMTGFEVARVLRAELPRAPHLVALTGYARPEDLARAAEAGFDGHVAKPADPEKIRRLLGHQASA